jgi:hypothetical protein
MLFVGTDLHETPIPFHVCRHQPTGDTNPHNCLLSRHQPTYKFTISSYAFPSLVFLLLLSSPNLPCARYFFLHQIFSTLATSAFAMLATQSLLLVSSDLLDARSFYFLQICSTLAPSVFSRSAWHLLLLILLFLHHIFFLILLVLP